MSNIKNIFINVETGLPESDIHNYYPKIHKRFIKNLGCIGHYKTEWETYVYTLNNKIVAILSHNRIFDGDILTIKLRVENNMSLRDMYSDIIIPGYHMNKIHWSSIKLNKIGELPLPLIYELIDESYFLVYTALPKRERILIDEINGELHA
ncbi:MAG: MmcQ/YjbR family DNA-binding protein [Spirochaetaceae bacterium]|nr:MmcQ/YjbR family DNA-binding protein [Spirochaetaceae bacterium]